MARGSSWAELPWDEAAVSVCVVTGLQGACRGESIANSGGGGVAVRTSSVGRFWLGAVVSIGVKSDHEVVTTGAGDLRVSQ
jgi:hypothetical protein